MIGLAPLLILIGLVLLLLTTYGTLGLILLILGILLAFAGYPMGWYNRGAP